MANSLRQPFKLLFTDSAVLVLGIYQAFAYGYMVSTYSDELPFIPGQETSDFDTTSSSSCSLVSPMFSSVNMDFLPVLAASHTSVLQSALA